MTQLFEPTRIATMSLINRFVRSATWEGLADEKGYCTPKLTELMVTLANGEVGMIITGHAYVSPEGQAGPWQLSLCDDSCIAPLQGMVDLVHQTDTKIVAQLAHAGAHAATKITGLPVIGPSTIHGEKGHAVQQMSVSDIERVVEAFGQAAARAKSAHFAGVQIHAAHGYLLSQFLSPFYNRRTDDFGGTPENRARIVVLVIERIRKYLGQDFPVLVKMNSEDFLQPGLTQDEMLRIAALLERAGINAIELSGGTISSGRFVPVRKGTPSRVEEEVYYYEAARRFKQTFDMPLILVGGIRSFEVAEHLVKEGVTDYISMSRPLIREPHLIHRWRTGDRTKAACDSDNLCFRPAMTGKGLYCVVMKQQQKA